MLESKRCFWIALAMVMVPLNLAAMPEEIWCYGAACRCCPHLPLETPLDGSATNLSFSIDLRFDDPEFPPGSSLKFLRANEGAELVFELGAFHTLSGSIDLFLKYQISSTVFTSINVGTIPTGLSVEEIKIARRLTGGGRGAITVTRGGLTYSTGNVLMSGQPGLMEQGVLELIGAANGWVAMTPPEIE